MHADEACVHADEACMLAHGMHMQVGLFFLLAFVNTILDSLKDTLVITAVGGGAQVCKLYLCICMHTMHAYHACSMHEGSGAFTLM
eukprot:366567-Chlamydomonas_euryale.AAC.12